MSTKVSALPSKSASLTRSQASSYLTRLLLPQSLLDEPASHSLLSQLLLAHHEQVPKDTSPMHVPSHHWTSPESQPIILGSSFDQMPVGVAAYPRIVKENKGAFCFAMNPTFAALLRYWGFRVSELATRCYQNMGANPEEHEDGWKWGALTHEVLVVDWEVEGGGRSERFLVDVGMGGGGCASPLELKHGAQIMGLNDYEAFQLLNEPIPLNTDAAHAVDVLPGWTLYRRVAPPGTPITLPITPDSPGYWSPQAHFLLHSISLIEFEEHHHFSAFSPLASFTAFLLVTKLIPGTGGARRSIMFSEGKNGKKKEGLVREGKRMARVHTTGGWEAKGSTEARDVEYVEMETGAMREELERNWGFKF